MENEEKKGIKLPLEAIALVFLFFVFLFFRGSGHFAYGGVGDNIRGYAWSSNFGWISLNCMNDGSCGTSNYGVKINDYTAPSKVFNFEGYAWSANAGWISFDETGAPDYLFNPHCKSSCNQSSAPPCTACFNPDDGNIYGWAKVLSFGNDGWIRLSSTTNSVGVSLDQTSASGTLRGWGWNGNTGGYTGLGWVSFNCANTGTCATVNYFAYLASSHLPIPQNLSAPNYPTSTACAAGVAKNAFLDWQFHDQDAGSSQTAFEVILNTANSTTTPLLDTGKRKLSVPQYDASNTSGLLAYDTPYYWWVRVWDDFGFVSHWAQFNTSTPADVLTDNVARNKIKGNAMTFTTYRHELPNAFFHKVPAVPIAYYPVTSTDASFYYTDASPGTRAACNKTNCSWVWTGAGNISNSATTSSSTVMTFSYGPNRQINLKVRDQDGYNCSTSSSPFFVDLLPVWIEKKAQ